MDQVKRRIQSVGKAEFVRHFHLFQSGNAERVKDVLRKQRLKDSSVNTKASSGIFLARDFPVEALWLVAASKNVDHEVVERAKDLLRQLRSKM